MFDAAFSLAPSAPPSTADIALVRIQPAWLVLARGMFLGLSREVIARTYGPGVWSLVVMLAFGCSESDTSQGCGSSSATQRCEINANATVCGDRITLECFDGETPEAKSQCEKALEQDEDAVYCCTSNAAADADAEANDPAVGGGGGAGA